MVYTSRYRHLSDDVNDKWVLPLAVIVIGVMSLLTIFPPPVTAISTNMTVVNASTWCAKFNGTIEGITETVWFEYSMNSDTDSYSMKTKNISASGIFNYSQCGMPLLPGYTYKVNAFNNSGNGTKETFAMPTITPHPTTTYEQYVDRFLEASDNPKEMIVTIWTP